MADVKTAPSSVQLATQRNAMVRPGVGQDGRATRAAQWIGVGQLQLLWSQLFIRLENPGYSSSYIRIRPASAESFWTSYGRIPKPRPRSKKNGSWLFQDDFNRLVQEVTMADAWIVRGRLRQTLVENGIPAERIHVAPYGVDAERFQPAPANQRCGAVNGPLKLLFVGRIVQRKGIKYLLEALRQFPERARGSHDCRTSGR